MKKILLLFVLSLIFVSCSEEYKECQRRCSELEKEGTLVFDIEIAADRSWATVVYDVILEMPVTQWHYETAIVMSNGEKITVDRSDITRDMKVYKIPKYRPHKIEKDDLVRYEPMHHGFKYDVRKN